MSPHPPISPDRFDNPDDVELGETAADEPDDPTERLRIFLRGAFADEFLTADYLTLRITLWAISRTDPEMAEVERGLYIRYSRHLEQRSSRHVGGPPT